LSANPSDDSVPDAELPDEQWLERVVAADHDAHADSIEGYQILHEVVRGGQGVVYQARDRESGELVALKRMLAGPFASAENRDRFRREMAVVARFDHEGIVRLHGFVEADGQPVLVFGWIDGKPADVWAQLQVGPDRVATILRTFVSACRAVQHAHDLGVVHRDLKPSNLLIDADDKPHVLDFGIAQDQFDTRLTRTGDFLGSPQFCAPEQLTLGAHKVDARSDVYALGVILYLQLTGRLPIDTTANPAGPAHAVLTQKVVPPTTVVPGLPGNLDKVLLEALCKDPKYRYQTVGELADDVARVMRSEVPRANPSSVRRQLAISYRKRPAVYALTVVLVVAVSVLGGGLYAAAMRVDETRTTVEDAKVALREMLRSHKSDAAGRDRSPRERADAMAGALRQMLPDAPELYKAFFEDVALLQLEALDGPGAIASLTAGIDLLRQSDDDAGRLRAASQLVRAHVRLGDLQTARSRLAEIQAELRSRGDIAPEASAAVFSAGVALYLATGELELAEEMRLARAAASPPQLGSDAWVADLIDAHNILSALGRRDEALQLCKAFVRDAERHSGARSLLSAEARQRLGMAFLDLSDYPSAEQQCRIAFEIREELDAPAIQLAQSLVFVAQFAATGGRPQEALGLTSRVFELLEGCEDAHGIAGLAYCYRGKAHEDLGQPEEALEDLRSALALQDTHLGPDHASVAHTRLYLANTLIGARQFEEAGQHLVEAERVFLQRYGPDHRELGLCFKSQANLAVSQRQFDLAADWLTRTRDHLLRTCPAGTPYLTPLLNYLGNVHVARSDGKAARESFEAAGRHAPPGHPATAQWRRASEMGMQFARLIEIRDRVAIDADWDWQSEVDDALAQLQKLEAPAASVAAAQERRKAIQELATKRR